MREERREGKERSGEGRKERGGRELQREKRLGEEGVTWRSDDMRQ